MTRMRGLAAAVPSARLQILRAVVQLPRKQPAYAEHIHRGADSAIAEAIFALAKFSGAMVDGNLDQPVAGPLNERWNEPMHALERHERPDAFAPHRFESAARVAHAVFRETAADKIGNPAGEALDERVLALRAVAADQIGTALDLDEKARNVGRIVLQIAVDEHNDGAAGGVGTGIHGCALAGIFFE